MPKVMIELDNEDNSDVLFIKSEYLKKDEELTKPEILEAIIRQTSREEKLEKVRKDKGEKRGE